MSTAPFPRLLRASLMALFIVMQAGCTQRDATLMERLGARLNLPNAGSSLSGNGDLTAWFVDATTIAGYHDAFAFRSDNSFLTLTAFEASIQAGDTVVQEGYVIRQEVRGDNLLILESFDYGLSFRPWRILDQSASTIQYEAWLFDAPQQAWAFSYQAATNALRLLRFEGAGVSTQAELDWPDWQPVELVWAEEEIGWVLLKTRAPDADLAWALSYTLDGGITWQDPIPTGEEPINETIPRLHGSEHLAMITWSDRNLVYAFDRRLGDWLPIGFGGSDRVVLTASDQDVFLAATQQGEDRYGRLAFVWRCQGDRESWRRLSETQIYADQIRAAPANPNLYLAFSRDVLQISRDRGESWTLLGFPL